MTKADAQLIAETRQRCLTGGAREIRKRTLLTQQQVARTLSTPTSRVSRASVAAWETGRRLPRGDHALAYGRLLRELANWSA